jgi:hypothetical protein
MNFLSVLFRGRHKDEHKLDAIQEEIGAATERNVSAVAAFKQAVCERLHCPTFVPRQEHDARRGDS